MKPILFNTEMVRAIQNGTKTVTRRLIKEKTAYPLACRAVCKPVGLMTASGIIRPKYKIGDILYVRETWQYGYDLDEYERLIENSGRYIYYAENPNPFSTWIMPDGTKREAMPWRSSIHMPKEAARIFLRVTDVRVERLQDIKIRDIVAEGIYEDCQDCFENYGYGNQCCIGENDECHLYDDAVIQFENVWNSTIKKSDLDKYGWNANPWVWVIEFERISKEEATK